MPVVELACPEWRERERGLDRRTSHQTKKEQGKMETLPERTKMGRTKEPRRRRIEAEGPREGEPRMFL